MRRLVPVLCAAIFALGVLVAAAPPFARTDAVSAGRVTSPFPAVWAAQTAPGAVWWAASVIAAARHDAEVQWYAVATWNAALAWNEAVAANEQRAREAAAVDTGHTGPRANQRTVLPRVDSSWDGVAQCESGGDWSINTGNGYFGGLQMNMAFWHAHCGDAYASRPDLATREQQIAVADGQARSNWPVCGR